MYNVVQFKPVTNREDFVINASVFDQDTGVSINLASITGTGTFSSWNVSVGSILTTSSSTLTIPTYPIGAQLLAVALTVPTNLAITAGMPITITDVSGKNSMSGFVTSYAAATGALVCQIGLSFQFEIRKKPPDLQGLDVGVDTGFAPFFDIGIGSDTAPQLIATLGPATATQGGIMITDVGFYQILIPATLMRQLHGPRTFRAALTITNSQDTRQLFIGDLPIIYGGTT